MPTIEHGVARVRQHCACLCVRFQNGMMLCDTGKCFYTQYGLQLIIVTKIRTEMRQHTVTHCINIIFFESEGQDASRVRIVAFDDLNISFGYPLCHKSRKMSTTDPVASPAFRLLHKDATTDMSTTTTVAQQRNLRMRYSEDEIAN